MSERERTVQDFSLAPSSWDSYVGQERTKERLEVQIKGALSRFENLKHTLLLGPPGYGKTSLAELIAEQMQQDMVSMMITPDFKPNVINKKIGALEEPGIVFMDEIHNFSKKGQHYLFDVMEKNKLTYDDGSYFYLEVPVTILAATTEEDKLVKPLFARFTNKHFLQEYSDQEMAEIVKRMAHKIGIEPTDEFCLKLGRASAGVPRQARALVYASQDLDTQEVKPILDLCGVSPEGLTEDHLSYLSTLNDLGQKAGVKTIANHAQRPMGIIEDLEKYLVKKQFVTIGSSGRSLSHKGLSALKRNSHRL